MNEAAFLGSINTPDLPEADEQKHLRRRKDLSNAKKDSQIKLSAADEVILDLLRQEISKQRDVFISMPEEEMSTKSPDELKIELLAGKRYVHRLESIVALIEKERARNG